MNTKLIAVSLVAVSAVASNASPFSFVNKYDNTISTASASNLNRSFGATGTSTTVTSANQSWWQFDGASIDSQLTTALGAGYQINSVALQFFTQVTTGPNIVDFHFNSNGSWLGDISATNQDPATTPQLTFNTSGQTLNGFTAVNGRFLGSDVFMASKTFSAADNNAIGSLDLSSVTDLRISILSASGFTLMAKPNSLVGGGVVSFVQKEGVAGGTIPGSIAPTLVIDAQPVPEPATMAALGLGLAALLRRRKR